MKLHRESALKAGLCVALIFGGSSAARCQADARPSSSDRGPSASADAPVQAVIPPSATKEEQARVLAQSAATAWKYVARNYSSSSGMVKSLDTWDYVTIWDIASAAAAYHAAYGLKLIDQADYRERMTRLLQTLETAPLYQGVAFNKLYASRSGSMVDRAEHVSSVGHGWSAVDIGRFLVWMRIVARNDAELASAVQRVVQRLDLQRLVKDGYLNGANLDPDDHDHHEYQEGRLGYEQYAAEGFALWGARAEKALDFNANGSPADMHGVRVLDDKRGADLLTSEPFIMMGMELGWTNPQWEEQARNVLAAQEERFTRTGTMTMLSEDAVPVKPAYFYYYLLRSDGKNFVVRSPTGEVSNSYPRWVSAKAAFGWYALFPSEYTWNAVRTVLPAGSSGDGWTAGVYERSKRRTPSYNLNTAALVLEAAYYAQRGCAFIRPSCQ